jgi:hypothetical protein
LSLSRIPPQVQVLRSFQLIDTVTGEVSLRLVCMTDEGSERAQLYGAHGILSIDGTDMPTGELDMQVR